MTSLRNVGLTELPAALALASDTVLPGDVGLLAASPVAVVPRFGGFVPLATPGRRVLIAGNGVFLEACCAVLYCRVQLAACDLPYGKVTAAITLLHGKLSRDLHDQLLALALSAHPAEMAAVVVRSENGTDALIVPDQSAGVGHVTYADAEFDESRLLIDAHSHGPYRATFSSADDASDRSRIGPHISLLFGSCDCADQVRVAARLCIGNHLCPLDATELRELFD